MCQKAQEPISLLEVNVPFGTVVEKKEISLKRVEYKLKRLRKTVSYHVQDLSRYEFALTEEARQHWRHLLNLSKDICDGSFSYFLSIYQAKFGLNTHQMYPSTLCVWRVSHIARIQFTQLTPLHSK